MPEIPNRREQFSLKYDAMEDEALRDILRADASKPEAEESDIEELLYVMELLAKRRSERGEARDPYKALENFKKYYDPTHGHNSDDPKPAAVRHGWIRRIAVLAAAAAFVVMTVASAGAARFNLWETIAKWTQETFHWGTAAEVTDWEPEKEGELACRELQEALEQTGVTEKLAPTWLPDGYEFSEIQTIDRPSRRVFSVRYCNSGDKDLIIQVQDYITHNPEQVEQSESIIDIIHLNGTDYYIIDNYGQMRIAFLKQHFECGIWGDYSLDEAKLIIESIEKG